MNLTKNTNNLTSRFKTVILIFIGIAIVMYGLLYTSSYINNATRGFVHGEGLWAKAQKEAVFSLSTFIESHDKTDWINYEEAIDTVIHNLTITRNAVLHTTPPNYSLGKKSFIEAGLFLDDVESMLIILRYGHTYPYFRDAVVIWEEADIKIEELQRLARNIQNSFSQGSLNEEKKIFQQQLKQIDEELTEKELEFSTTLAKAAHFVSEILLVSIFIILLILLMVSLFIGRNIISGIHQSVMHEKKVLKEIADKERITHKTMSLTNNKLNDERKKFESMIEDLGEKFVVYSHDLLGKMLYVSGGIETVFGQTKEEVLGTYYQESVNWTGDSLQKTLESISLLLNNQIRSNRIELSFIHPDGNERVVSVTSHVAIGIDGKTTIDGIVQDITQDKMAEELINKQKIELDLLLQTVPYGIQHSDKEGVIVYSNSAHHKLLGLEDGQLIGQHIWDFQKGEQQKNETKEYLAYLVKERPEPTPFTALNIDEHGNELVFEVVWDYLYNDDGTLYGFISIISDVTERQKMIETIKQQSITDELTQLHNRKAFNDRIKDLIEEFLRYEKVFSMLMIDLDHFKLINDTYGHQIGDEVLKALADLMKKITRKTDCVYRFGGEEFVILLSNTHLKEAGIFAEKLRNTVQKELKVIEDREITISVGVAEIIFHDNYDSLVKRVDENLYTAKNSGRNKVVTL